MRINRLLAGLALTTCGAPALSDNHQQHGQQVYGQDVYGKHVYGQAAYGEHGHGDADPLLTKVMIDKLEAGDTKQTLDAQAWLGKDLDKLWIKVAIEDAQTDSASTELQALYSHAISPYWDLQLGLRQDNSSGPSRSWGVLGIQGLAPYFFDVEATLFIGEQGRSAARFKVEYDLLFTQQLILSPALELNAYAQDDPATGKGSGLAESEAGLRLRYELRRELAPYVGINWHRAYGSTAALARAEQASEYQWVLGLRAWF